MSCPELLVETQNKIAEENGNMSVYPMQITRKFDEGVAIEMQTGLTKREHIATQIAAGIAEPNCKDYAVIARKAVAITDELLKALSK